MAIPTLAAVLLAALGLDKLLWPTQTTLTDGASYDYIVIGGGTAGSLVATRLAEDQKYNVLLLEAGDNPPEASLLAEFFAFLPSTEIDYDYRSTSDVYAAGGQGNNTKLTAGKMLGGSSGLNHLLTLRGVPSDYDYWAEITGDDSWKYDNILKYFIKSEGVNDDEIISQYGDCHGTGGLMGLTRQTHDDDVADYLASWAEVGNPEVLDLNCNATVGYTQPLLMVANNLRQQTAYSYLQSVKDYPNLSVSKNTRVSKIIFENKVAVGVEAIYDGKTYTLKANKEIILSAGTFGSPSILMRSGIGPADHLKSFDIDTILDVPVGNNLVIPAAVCVVHKTKEYTVDLLYLLNLLPALNPTQLPFPVLVGSVALNKSDTVPNYQTYNLIIPHDTPFLALACSSVYGYRSEICSRLVEQATFREVLYSVVAELEPKSRGTVRLNSTDPFDDPLITTGFFTDSEDLEKMLKNIKDFISIGESTFFKKEEAALIGLDLPECADKESGSDEFWKCYILNMAISPFLYAGTCPMGTVVDGELKLIGVENLRIVDSSVLPKLIHSAPNAAIVMLAEKASDMIKNSAAN